MSTLGDRSAHPREPEADRLEILMARIRAEPARFPDAGAVAAAGGWAEDQAEALFQLHGHRPVAAFLAEARVQCACRRLLAGSAPTDAATAAGFGDPAQFRHGFLAGTGMAPEAYQALGRPGAPPGFTLALPADYRAEDVLAYHGRDPESRSEQVAGATLRKAMLVAGRTVLLETAFQDGQARCRVLDRDPDRELLAALHRRAVRMLGLGFDPAPFERFVADLALNRLVAPRQGLRIPLTADVWEALVWAVLGQQVNLAFAYALRRRLTALCGPAAGRGMTAHPGPAAVAALEPEQLKPLQFSRGKADYLVGLARKVTEGSLPLETLPDGTASRAAALLSAQRGVGPWTTHYVLMRGCGFGDCVPLGDAGLTLALQRHLGLDHRPGLKETAACMAPFAPFRSLATFHLWASLKGVPA